MNKLYIKKTINQPVYNDGLNESNLEFEKQTILFDAVRSQTKLVNTTKHYPKDNSMNIDLELDLVIMKISEYEKLKEYQSMYESLNK